MQNQDLLIDISVRHPSKLGNHVSFLMDIRHVVNIIQMHLGRNGLALWLVQSGFDLFEHF